MVRGLPDIPVSGLRHWELHALAGLVPAFTWKSVGMKTRSLRWQAGCRLASQRRAGATVSLQSTDLSML